MKIVSTLKILTGIGVIVVVGVAAFVAVVLFSADYSVLLERVDDVIERATETIESADLFVSIPLSGSISLRPKSEATASEIVQTVEELRARIADLPAHTRVVVYLDHRPSSEVSTRSFTDLRASLTAGTSAYLSFIDLVPEGTISE